MSTRATYEIEGTMFYIHHDGYPAGAANYFAQMIDALTVPAKAGGVDAIDERRGGATFAFIRGNLRAEPTESHDAHGDTQHRWRLTHDGYRYHVQSQARTDSFVKWTAWSSPRPISDFINAHYPGAIVAIDAPDAHWKRELVASIEHAVGIAAEHRRQEAGFQDGNPNKPHHAEHAAAWERELFKQLPARCRWLEGEEHEAAAELAKNPTWGRAYYERRLEDVRRELAALRVPIGPELVAAD